MGSDAKPIILRRYLHIMIQNFIVAVAIAVFFLTCLPWWLLWPMLFSGGLLYISVQLIPLVNEWRPKHHVLPKGKAVFITGCDSGFGHALAQSLDDLGLHVFAGCLFPDKEGAQTLKKSSSERLHVVPLDVTSDESVQNALKYIRDNISSNKFWALVNNAGMNAGGEIAWTSLDVIKKILDVNAFGAIRVTKTFLPLLCRDQGRIVTVAASAGRYSYPTMVPYCVSKHFLVSFCEDLRLELYRFGVRLILMEPFKYKTPIQDEDIVLNYISKSWNESSDEIKSMYPENYLDKVKRVTSSQMGSQRSNRFQDVVECLEEAIMAIEPKFVYSPGTLSAKIGNWFLLKCPQPIADYFLHDYFLPSF